MSYPVFQFRVSGDHGSFDMRWFPSEYLYRDRDDRYCLAAERSSRSNEVLLGGTFMRQQAFVFDTEGN
jgi:hypothetical protein